MDFKVNGLELSFIGADVLSSYLIFYFSNEWYNYNRQIIIKDATKETTLVMDKNYIELPKSFLESKIISVKVVGVNKYGDRRETNNEIGRR